MVQDMSMIYNKNLTGSLVDFTLGYCNFMVRNHHNETLDECEPDNIPSATGYTAYIHLVGIDNQYHFSNVIDRGSRDVVVPHTTLLLKNVDAE